MLGFILFLQFFSFGFPDFMLLTISKIVNWVFSKTLKDKKKSKSLVQAMFWPEIRTRSLQRKYTNQRFAGLPKASGKANLLMQQLCFSHDWS